MTPALDSPNTPLRDEQIRRVLAGEHGAFSTLLRQLSSDNPWLQDMLMDGLYACDEPALWGGLLTGLALHGWEAGGTPGHGLTPEAQRRLDDAVMRLFTVDQAGAPSTAAKLAAAAEMLGAADPRVRSLAAVVLARRGDARGLADLQAAAIHGDPDERRRAVPALGKLDDERAAWILVEVLAGDDEALHPAAGQALDELGALAAPALLAALAHPREPVRWHAARALGALGQPDTAPALAHALADPEYRVRWTAAEALVNLGPEAVPAILDQLTRSLPMTDSLKAARYALHRIGPHHMQAWLEPLLHALNGPAAPAEAPGLAYRLLQEWREREGEVRSER